MISQQGSDHDDHRDLKSDAFDAFLRILSVVVFYDLSCDMWRLLNLSESFKILSRFSQVCQRLWRDEMR